MKQHRYRFTVEYIADPEGNPQQVEPLVFEADSHDEILGIVELVRGSNVLDAESTAALVVGQKLMGGVVMANRDQPLFAGFWPNFVAFMKEFKALIKK